MIYGGDVVGTYVGNSNICVEIGNSVGDFTVPLFWYSVYKSTELDLIVVTNELCGLRVHVLKSVK